MQSTYVATPACQGCCCKSPNTRHTGRTYAALSSTQPVPSLPIPTSDRSHHDFSTFVSFMKIYIKTCPMVPIRRQSFAPRPNEATLADDKGARDRIDSALDIQ